MNDLERVKMKVGGKGNRRPLFQRKSLDSDGNRIMKFYCRHNKKYHFLFSCKLREIGDTQTRKALIKHAKATA